MKTTFVFALMLWVVVFSRASSPRDFSKQVSSTQKECKQPLGIETGKIPNSALAAASTSGNKNEPFMARLSTSSSAGNLSCWRAGHNRKQQWLRVDLGKVRKVTSVATQGNPHAGEWVIDYVIEFGYDDKHWSVYRENEARKMFKGNKNRNTTVTNTFTHAVLARYIRIKVMRWKKHIALRMELYGCDSVSACCLPLGVEDRRIPNKAITASSSYSKTHSPASARLHFQTRSTKAAGWKSKKQDGTPWLQVDFQSVRTITGIGTQGGRSSRGGRGGWVAEYTLSFSDDGTTWQTKNQSSHVKEFPGNNDTSTVVINKFSSPFRGQFVRIYPLQLKKKGYLRVELYGCWTHHDKDVDNCSSSPCHNNGTCTDHVNNFTCTCSPGFTGKTCSTGVNECSSSPCKNNATCADYVNGFTCSCLPGFTGNQCETVLDECSSYPCRNNATCADHVGEYTCACPLGFTGRNCEIEPCRRCGRRTVSRIVGGSVALPGAWPWHVGLLDRGASKIFCGGALISKEWVVTAAHCVLFRTASSLRVVLGEYDVRKKEGIEVYTDVVSVHAHQGYNWITANHDIALLRIKPAISQFNRFISPVCLPAKDDVFSVGTNCTITGFGRLEQGGITASQLRQAVVPLVDRNTCEKAYPNHVITAQMTCAGYTEGGIDSCQGDSGGPLVCRNDSVHWYLVGVISWGIGCAHPKSYGVYNNVREERKWIDEELRKLNSSACTEKV